MLEETAKICPAVQGEITRNSINMNCFNLNAFNTINPYLYLYTATHAVSIKNHTHSVTIHICTHIYTT